jgi:hydrogenase expression/formation protein HypC
MCVAIPYKVLEVSGNGRAQIEVGSTRQEISTLLVPEVTVGDYVLVYLGCATARIEEQDAMDVISLFEEIAEADTLLDSCHLGGRNRQAEGQQ